MFTKISIALLCLVLGFLFSAPATCADGYKDWLVQHYPFYHTAVGRFAPVYPALAKQIVQDYGITRGVCVDVGGGCGMLAIALARITDLTVYVLDIDPYAVHLCNLLADEADLTGRVRGVEGDAQDMPFRDNFADLVVSRGSIFFWPDQFAGLKEAYRILKPGGAAYIGGGFSRILDPKIRDQLVRWRQQSLTADGREPGGWRPIEKDLLTRARAAGMTRIRMITEPQVGWWIELIK